MKDTEDERKRLRREYLRKWREKNRGKISEQSRAYYARNAARLREKNRERAREYRLNNLEKERARGRSNNKKYYDANREMLCKASREYHAQNGEKIRETKRRYFDANRTSVNERIREWKRANPKKVLEAQRRYHAINPGAGSHTRAIRRARLVLATPNWVDCEALRVVYKRAAELGMVVDHIIPLKNACVCGLHVPWNLQFLTRLENAQKGNKFFGGERGV